MKIEKKALAFLCLLYVVLVFLVYYLGSTRISEQKHSNESIEKIDSLDSKVNSIYVIRDSISEKIDTVYVKLEDNNKQYEKNFNRVINNDVNEDYMFFLNYINSNRARLDSIGNNL